MSASDQPSIEEQREFWDWHWEHWIERRTINEWKDKRHAKVLDFLRSLPLDRPKILDIGCGPGWYTEKLSHFAGEVTGIDLSEEAIQMAKSSFPHINFICGNLYKSRLPVGDFDVVISQEVFDHVEDQVRFLEIAKDTLREGGFLIITCTNRFVMDRLEDGQFPSQPPQHIAKYLNMKEFKRLVDKHFKVLKAKSVIPVVGRRGIFRLINSYKINRLLGLCISRGSLEVLLERTRLGYQLVLVAQRR